MCYADVEAGQVYLLFLTTFQGRLSAKYDDIFGAASEHTDENEEEVLTALGESALLHWRAKPNSSICFKTLHVIPSKHDTLEQ